MLQIHGVDTSVGLTTANHNEALYRRLLAKFCQIEGLFTSTCRALIADGRAVELKRRAHDLRSTGAALGALEVAALAATLEAAVVRGVVGQPLLDQVDALDRRLAPVLAAMTAAVAAGAPQAAPALPAPHEGRVERPLSAMAAVGAWR